MELSSDCYGNFELITSHLVSMHHRPDPQIAKEWEVCVFVGVLSLGWLTESEYVVLAGVVNDNYVYACNPKPLCVHLMHFGFQ